MDEPTRETYLDIWSEIVAHAWGDENFKKRVLVDPVAVLREHGYPVPDDVKVKVVEGRPDPKLAEEDGGEVVAYLPLPARPPEAEQLADGDLDSVVG